MSIVISDNVTLSEDEENAGVNANNPRIGYHNIITSTNISSDEADASYPLFNLTNPATYLRWRGESDGEQSIVINLGSSETVNYFGLAAHNLGSIGATIVLQKSEFVGSPATETWTDISTERMLANDNAFVEEFENVTANKYRLLITPQNGSDPPEIGILYVGRILRMQRRIYVGHQPITLSRRTIVSSGRSESGQFLGRVRRSQYLETTANFRHLTPTWVRNYFEPFMQSAETVPFFWAGRPGDYPDEVAFCWLTEDPKPTNQLANGFMSVDISIQGVR